MRILHTADNHLGREEFSKIDPKSGMNARGLDYLESFKNICKIALSEHVDIFIIAGDMFDNPQPKQYYIIESMKILKKISKAGIITLIINGNADISNINNPLLYLAEIDNVYVVTKPETLIFGSYDIVCVPYSDHDFTTMLEQALLNSPSENKILVTHRALKNATQGSELYESITPIDITSIPDKFVYGAFGHMHRFQQINHTVPIFYSGSSERFDFSEEGEDKYALLIDLDNNVSIKPYRLPIRPLYSFDIDCSSLDVNSILNSIDDIIEDNDKHINNSIIKVMLYNLNLNEKNNLDINKIKEKFASSFECIIDIKTKGNNQIKMPRFNDILYKNIRTKPHLIEIGNKIFGEYK
jgi:exonuclease SbcD